MITAKEILFILMQINSPSFDYSVVEMDEAYCMAMNVYYEAASEPVEGKIAVAQTVMERVHDRRFPDTVCGVVHQGRQSNGIMIRNQCAFSWYCDGLSDDIHFYDNNIMVKSRVTAYLESAVIALSVMSNEIETKCSGANHYYNPSLANPKWSDYYDEVCTVGNHVFLRREIGSLK